MTYISSPLHQVISTGKCPNYINYVLYVVSLFIRKGVPAYIGVLSINLIVEATAFKNILL